MPYGHQIWLHEPLTRVLQLIGIKGHAWVILGQPEVKLLMSTLWSLNSTSKTLDQGIANYLGQRSCRCHSGSTRGQFAKKICSDELLTSVKCIGEVKSQNGLSWLTRGQFYLIIKQIGKQISTKLNPCSPEGFSQTYFPKGGLLQPPSGLSILKVI